MIGSHVCFVFGGSHVHFVFAKVGAARRDRRARPPIRGGLDYWQAHNHTGMSMQLAAELTRIYQPLPRVGGHLSFAR